MKNKIFSFSLLFWLFLGMCNCVIAQTADRELLVQFKSEIFPGSGGAYPSAIVVNSSELDSLFTVNNVEYLEKVFTGFPKTTIVNGFTVDLPDFDHYYLVPIRKHHFFGRSSVRLRPDFYRAIIPGAVRGVTVSLSVAKRVC